VTGDSLRNEGLEVLLVTGGVGGDAVPFAALHAELIGRGHRPRLACSPLLAVGLRQLGIPAIAVGAAQERIALRWKRALLSSTCRGWLSWMVAIDKFYDPWSFSALPQLERLVSASDVVVTHPLAAGAYEACDARNTPCITLGLFPCLRPDQVGRDLSIGGADEYHDRVRIRLEKPWQLTPGAGLWSRWAATPELVLLEETIADGMKVSGETVGFPRWRVGEDSLPVEVLDERQSPTLVICQGTLLGRQRPWLNQAAVAAGRRLGMDIAVLGTDLERLDVQRGPDLKVYPFKRLAELLPRANVLIHHFGAGTLREAIVAKTPAIGIPGPFDTFWNSDAFSGPGLVNGKSILAYQRDFRHTVDELERLISLVNTAKWATSMKTLDHDQSLTRIVDRIESLANR
jgi:hypothetical protein